MSVDSTLYVNKRILPASFSNQGSLKIFTGKRKLTRQTAYLSRTKVPGQDFKKQGTLPATGAPTFSTPAGWADALLVLE